MRLPDFLAKWAHSEAQERANKDSFLSDLCDVLGVPRPDPAGPDPERNRYVFERAVALSHEDGVETLGRMDLYKEDCFILEAKQGAEAGSKAAVAKRGTPRWEVAMQDAYGQALKYAHHLDRPPPFVVTCDIGYCFDLYAAFGAERAYRPFPNARRNRIFLADIGKHLDLFRALWTDPQSVDPSRKAIKVTRDVAAHLAELARALEKAGNKPDAVATFLMRCIFTMFAEDIGLLPRRVFVEYLERTWIPHPERFPKGVQFLWRNMDTGGGTPEGDLILHFNGGLFHDPTALPLSAEQLGLLLEAARCDWSEVEPSIFGTLVERALDPEERHRLGAHYTPRAYVERLVRATVEEPLRAEWDAIRAAVRVQVEQGKTGGARKSVAVFYRKLCETRVLDPACGTGNFLYVTLDLFKRLETEVLSLHGQLGETGQEDIERGAIGVTPARFHGIEVNPRAKEIAELVLWIGYLQWHFRTHGSAAPREPVLGDYHTVECRDALLAWDRVEPAADDRGKPLLRWDGKSTKPHPVTGKEVPDEAKRVLVERYVNPRKAEWPAADYIVGNPPFVGNKRMRQALGDGYVEALRSAYTDVPDTSDFVMFWWDIAARLTRAGKVQRFGFITTNSITQVFDRKVVAAHLDGAPPLSLVFAIPDHPWVKNADGAAVRIAMTVGEPGPSIGRLATVAGERSGADAVDVTFAVQVGRLNPDLTVGAAVTRAKPLRACSELCWQGMKLVGPRDGPGFLLTEEERLGIPRAEREFVKPFLSNKDFVQRSRAAFVIDLFGLEEGKAREHYPALYQRAVNFIKPHRDHVARKNHRENWWIFGEPRPGMRQALRGLARYIVTPEVAKHRPFAFVEGATVPDGSLYAIASDDAFVLGVLSSRAHVTWALAAGGTLEDRPRYQNGPCFDPFPFPDASAPQRAAIRKLAEDLDAHRKRQQAAHPELTITGMYNVLAKLREGEALSDKEKAIHEAGLVSVLRQIHDDLDAAVFAAYGWPADLGDEEILDRLVALNHERADEEAKGTVRWLRPELQAKGRRAQAEQREMLALPTAKSAEGGRATWPKALPERIAAVRATLHAGRGQTVEAVAAGFTRAPRKDVELALDSLAALGLAVAYEAKPGRLWRLTARRAA